MLLIGDSIKQYYENGNIELEGLLISDKWEGLLIIYYEDGKVNRKLNYSNGELNGLEEVWFQNGQKFDINWKNDEKN